MIGRLRALSVVVASIVAALAALPAAGDWLVTREGKRIETRGPWEVKGRQVIFTLPNGMLSALRVADVDLEASEVANREAADAEPTAAADKKAADEAVESKPRKSVLVLTDEDIKSAEADSEDEGEADEDEAEGAEEDQPVDEVSREPVELISWRSQENAEDDGLEILGALRNTGQGIAAAISLTVTVPDEDGQPLFDTRAFLDTTALAPGKSTGFRALLPGIYDLLGDPSFEIKSEGLTVQGPADTGSSSGETEPGEEWFEGEPPPR